MIQIILILITTSILSISEDNFISQYDYGSMLYENPRGISCISCHGKYGEGKEIIRYIDNNDNSVIIKGSDIRESSLKDFHHALTSSHKVMPTYYLINKEIIAIYKYIKEKNYRLANPIVDVEDESVLIYDGDDNE